MIELSVSLASNGVVKVPGYEQMVRFGYTKNRGVYRLAVTATGEWEGLTIRAFWHVPNGKDPTSSLVVDGLVGVPASVTAQPGNGCITFEGSDGTRTVTSADLRYRVAANSGTEDGTEPEPGTPAWQELVGAVHTDATAAEQAKTDAQTAATESAASAEKAAASKKAAGDAQAKAAESLQELKNGIASGDFKGEPGTSPTVTVQDITGGHRIVITDATGTSSVDVLNGKQGDPGKPGDTGATPELTIGTVEEGDAPSATITGTAKNPVLNLTLKSGAPGKDATVDATLTQSGKAADAKVTGDALATKAVIDDTTVGTDAWSSKHIVDMLCPPLEETGNPVVFYPVAGYPLGCKASWEPVQAGSGEPSPENIRPIKGRDSVMVERCGENLIDSGRVMEVGAAYGLTAQYVSGKITISGIYSNTSTRASFAFMWLSYALSPTTALAHLGLKTSGCTLNGIRFTNKNRDSIAIDIEKCTNGEKIEISFYLIAYVGTTAPTTYSPYIGQTATLTLPETIYGGTVDAVTGEGHGRWKLLTLDGTEPWNAVGSGDTLYFQSTSISIGTRVLSRDDYCTTFPIASVSSSNTVQGVSGWKTSLYLRWSTFADVAALKSYLAAQYAAGTPVQVCYKLTEPVPFTATGAPQPIPALSGVNTVMTDADSVTVTGRADPIKRITDLEDAVASMTNT
jgi:hypothetical protein